MLIYVSKLVGAFIVAFIVACRGAGIGILFGSFLVALSCKTTERCMLFVSGFALTNAIARCLDWWLRFCWCLVFNFFMRLREFWFFLTNVMTTGRQNGYKVKPLHRVGFYLAARPIHNQLEVMHVVPISPWPFITATSIMFLLLSILNFFMRLREFGFRLIRILSIRREDANKVQPFIQTSCFGPLFVVFNLCKICPNLNATSSTEGCFFGSIGFFIFCACMFIVFFN
jgi:hypothetical protein